VETQLYLSDVIHRSPRADRGRSMRKGHVTTWIARSTGCKLFWCQIAASRCIISRRVRIR